MIIRAAIPEDAQAMTLLREASIRALCSADHHDDPATVEAWIGSPDKFVRLFERDDTTLIVIEIDGQMAGIAGFSGEVVTLNYVHPAFRLRGVSKALMAAAEEGLAAAGVAVARLNSTVTALPFYRALGWLETGTGSPEQGMPMRKRLS